MTRAGFAVGLVSSVLLFWSSDCDGQTKRMSNQDFDKMLKEVSNWGRWGKDDQLGALNLITPAKRKEAAALVKHGISISLARNAEESTAPDNPNPFQKKMLSTGQSPGAKWAVDNFSVSYHGYAHTHMDSLCHLFYGGRMYNGYSREEVKPTGAQKLREHIFLTTATSSS